jgi:hypothetical protein
VAADRSKAEEEYALKYFLSLMTPPDKYSLLMFKGMGINLNMTSNDLTGTLDLTVLTQDAQKVMKVDNH